MVVNTEIELQVSAKIFSKIPMSMTSFRLCSQDFDCNLLGIPINFLSHPCCSCISPQLYNFRTLLKLLGRTTGYVPNLDKPFLYSKISKAAIV